ncbi:MAG: hypothetical protein QM784_31830 [Polyangiaceae bacterium]
MRKIVELREITPERIAAIIGVRFSRDDESPYAEFFLARGSEPNFVARLTIDKNNPGWLLSVEFGVDYPFSRNDMDLARFGRPLKTTTNPDTGPEGVSSYIYRYRDLKLVLAFTSATERLAYFVLEREI